MLRAILTGAVLVALASAVFGTAPQPAQAAARLIAGGVAQINTTGEAKTDFHIVITSKESFVDLTCSGLLTVVPDPIPDPPDTVTGNGTNQVTLEWDVAIPQGSTVLAVWICYQDEKNAYSVKSFFTPEGSPTDSPTLGWRVNEEGAVALTNAYSSVIEFDDLRFQYPSVIDTDSLFDLLTNPATGDLAQVSSGGVPAGSDSDPGLQLVDMVDLDVGDLLTARLETNFADPGFSDLTATIVMGHEAQIGVGGIAQLPDVEPSLEVADSSGGSSAPPYAIIAGAAAAAVLAVTAGGWYARRRWLG